MVHDELSYVLGAETFLRGRLTNPPHVMARHFETFHVLQRPTYASKYPPANALVIAAGWKLGGEPVRWGGSLLLRSCARACAGCCSAGSGASWASASALGGRVEARRHILGDIRTGGVRWQPALVRWSSALAYRLIRAPSTPKAWVTARNAVVLALGLLVLANSRPYEGLWFALPVMMVLLVHLVRRQARGLEWLPAPKRRSPIPRGDGDGRRGDARIQPCGHGPLVRDALRRLREG